LSKFAPIQEPYSATFKKRAKRSAKRHRDGLIFLGVLGVVAGIIIMLVMFVPWPDSSSKPKWAGLSRDSVVKKATDAILNDDNFHTVKNFPFAHVTKKYFYGRQAWEVIFSDKQGNMVCPFIWHDRSYTDHYNWKILKGKNCI